MEAHSVSRQPRPRQAQLVDAAGYDAVRQRQGVDDELHGHCGRVQAAGDELLEECRLRGRLVHVERLPVEEREVVGLIYYHGWTQQQVAELLGVSERTVRRHWVSAVARLSTGLGGLFPGADD